MGRITYNERPRGERRAARYIDIDSLHVVMGCFEKDRQPDRDRERGRGEKQSHSHQQATDRIRFTTKPYSLDIKQSI